MNRKIKSFAYFVVVFFIRLGIITKGGTKPNIIPDQTELLYSIRAPTDSDLLILKDKVFKCFDAAAIATGCTVCFQTLAVVVVVMVIMKKWRENEFCGMFSLI